MSELLAERSGTTLILTLNRPEKVNALSAPLVEALSEQVKAAEVSGIRLLVLKGNGRNFSAGFDFMDYEAQSEGDLLLRFVRIELLLQALRHARYESMDAISARASTLSVAVIIASSLRPQPSECPDCPSDCSSERVAMQRRWVRPAPNRSSRKPLRSTRTGRLRTASLPPSVRSNSGRRKSPLPPTGSQRCRTKRELLFVRLPFATPAARIWLMANSLPSMPPRCLPSAPSHNHRQLLDQEW